MKKETAPTHWPKSLHGEVARTCDLGPLDSWLLGEHSSTRSQGRAHLRRPSTAFCSLYWTFLSKENTKTHRQNPNGNIQELQQQPATKAAAQIPLPGIVIGPHEASWSLQGFLGSPVATMAGLCQDRRWHFPAPEHSTSGHSKLKIRLELAPTKL